MNETNKNSSKETHTIDKLTQSAWSSQPVNVQTELSDAEKLLRALLDCPRLRGTPESTQVGWALVHVRRVHEALTLPVPSQPPQNSSSPSLPTEAEKSAVEALNVLTTRLLDVQNLCSQQEKFLTEERRARESFEKDYKQAMTDLEEEKRTSAEAQMKLKWSAEKIRNAWNSGHRVATKQVVVSMTKALKDIETDALATGWNGE